MMMSNIEFRAFDKETSKIMDWDTLCKNGDFTDFSDDRFVFMQFTGLRDNKGKKIFEGDVIRNRKERDEQLPYYECKYSNSKGKFIFVHIKSHSLNYEFQRLQECVVVGNVWDNPEYVDWL